MLSPNNFDNDKLALKPFSEKLEQFVTIDHDFAEGGLRCAKILDQGIRDKHHEDREETTIQQ